MWSVKTTATRREESSIAVAYAKSLGERWRGTERISNISLQKKTGHHLERERRLGVSSFPLYIDEQVTRDSSKNTQRPFPRAPSAMQSP
jgi:hypothetical protein